MSVKKFATIFEGLDEAFGTYEVQKTSASGKSTGQARIVREERTSEHWKGHLSGKGASIGIIPIKWEKPSVCIVIFEDELLLRLEK